VAFKEAALASGGASSSEGATPSLTDASLVHAAPADRAPLPAGVNGNKAINNIPFQARRLRRPGPRRFALHAAAEATPPVCGAGAVLEPARRVFPQLPG